MAVKSLWALRRGSGQALRQGSRQGRPAGPGWAGLATGLALAGLVLAVAGWAIACTGGEGPLRVEPSPAPGAPGSRESPVPFGEKVIWGSLEIEVGKWELIDCAPLRPGTPVAVDGDCPDHPFKDRMVRYFVSVRNVGEEAAPGPFRFFLIFDSDAYPNVGAAVEDYFPDITPTLEPGKAIEGHIFSVRPDRVLWDEGRVLLQTRVGPSSGPNRLLYWRIPPPPP